MRLLNRWYTTYALMRWALAVGWAVFLLAYLVQQPGSPPVEVVAPVAAPHWQREIAFTVGHISGFGMLFALWVGALRPRPRAGWGALIIAGGVGILAEFLQSQIPDRSASLYDLVMNAIGFALAFALIQRIDQRIDQRR